MQYVLQLGGFHVRRFAQDVGRAVGNDDHVAGLQHDIVGVADADVATSLDRQMKPGGPAIGGHRDRPRRREGGAKIQGAAQLQRIENVAQHIHLQFIACFGTMS